MMRGTKWVENWSGNADLLLTATDWNLDFGKIPVVGRREQPAQPDFPFIGRIVYFSYYLFHRHEEVHFWQLKRLVLRWITIGTHLLLLSSNGMKNCFSNVRSVNATDGLSSPKLEDSMQTYPTTFRICASYGLKDHQSNSLHSPCSSWIDFDNQTRILGAVNFLRCIWSMPWWGCNLNVVLIQTYRLIRFRDVLVCSSVATAIVCSTYNSRIIEVRTS